jgi:CRISPR-associated endonuclease Cas2
MAHSAQYIAVYDLADGERERAARVLEGYGIRVQKSVFELRLTKGQRERLLQSLDDLQLKSGSVLLYRRDATGKRYEIGTKPPGRLEENSHCWILGRSPPDPKPTPISKTPEIFNPILNSTQEVSENGQNDH